MLFGDRSVLQSCSLAIAGGDVLVISGDNGSGKTTLLRVLAGLLAPCAGQVSFAGEPVGNRGFTPAMRRSLQYVVAHPFLFSTSVRANLNYGLRANGTDRARCSRLTEAAIEWARLEAVVDTPPQRLSAGEKQRIAIARAWVLAPRLVLLDEPISNLDRASRAQVFELIGHMRAAGTAVLIAAHDRELIALEGARRLHLAEGCLEQVDADAPQGGA